MTTISPLRGLAVASFGVLALVGCDSLRIEGGVVNTDPPGAFTCAADSDCLDGYRCQRDLASGVSICTQRGLGIQCDEFDRDGDGFLVNAAPAECFGERGDCDDEDYNTHPGAPELCDGKDNNCDGTIDEGLDSVPCPKQLGVCSGAVTQCIAGEVQSCEGPTGSYATNNPDYSDAELCDGLDNNCDGIVDEGCCDPSRPLSGSQAGSNIGCTCAVGDAFACGTDTGVCTRGVRVCSANGIKAADLPCMEAKPEVTRDICNPDTDFVKSITDDDDNIINRYCVLEVVGVLESLTDDCRSSNDAGCKVYVWRDIADAPVGSVSCTSAGDCSTGEVCGHDNTCRIGNVRPSAEVCNGLDTDCDGSVDNHHSNAASSACGTCPFNSILIRTSAIAERCVDVYEASRIDATSVDGGLDNGYAVNAPGVMPWVGVNGPQARDACEGVEVRGIISNNPADPLAKRYIPERTLCSTSEFPSLCRGVQTAAGPGATASYPYGAARVDGYCNDTTHTAGTVLPTGSMPECRLPASATATHYDMTGNVAEWAYLPSGVNAPQAYRLAGGAYSHAAASCGANDQITILGTAQNATPPPVYLGACTADAECGTGNFCLTGRCTIGCNVNTDCDGDGRCGPRVATVETQKICHYPDWLGGDWSDVDTAGFRCCAAPLK